MSDAVISVEGLGKKYRISHQAERQRYTALRDVIAEKAKKLLTKLRHPISAFNSPLCAQNANAPISALPASEDFWALKDVSFEIKQGEVVGIIGRNGAGKSTLLKILSRITEPTKGRVHIKGRIASLLEVGTGFHPELTGRENIFLNGAILGMSRVEIRKKFDEIVAFAEVEKFLDTPVKRYSSGMYVRLAFAVAAHLEPEILIVDEVLAVGDSQFQKKCLGKMQEVATNEGRTVLFVSHQMGAVASLCKKGLLLENGERKIIGPVQNVIQEYLNSANPAYERYRANPNTLRNGDNKILAIQLEDVNGAPKNEFAYSENISLSIRLTLPCPTSNLFLGIGLNNHQQSRVFTVMRDISTIHSFPTNGEIKLRLPSSLIAPNRYTFTLAIFQHHGSLHDHVQNVCPISIFDDGSPLSRWEGIDCGSVVINPVWIK